ncbi:MAG: isochorismatase family protein [Proteobacteria bacterium]|nr:isochorismatase family protein [Pseudomonadota bacterium]
MPDGPAKATLTDLLAEAMPLSIGAVEIGARRTGLVIVDEVNGFATVGAGNLAPPVESPQVSEMIRETDRLAQVFTEKGWKILAFLDTHVPGKPEPPYPPHCEVGTGEEDLVAELTWLQADTNTTLVRKDCINGFIGAIRPDGSNAVVDWVNLHQLQALLVVGICTDICVMDFVLTSLSARNHDLMPGLGDIIVYAPGCATYDLPRSAATALGLPESLAHPGEVTQYMGLYFMASRGAVLADRVTVVGCA